MNNYDKSISCSLILNMIPIPLKDNYVLFKLNCECLYLSYGCISFVFKSYSKTTLITLIIIHCDIVLFVFVCIVIKNYSVILYVNSSIISILIKYRNGKNFKLKKEKDLTGLNSIRHR